MKLFYSAVTACITLFAFWALLPTSYAASQAAIMQSEPDKKLPIEQQNCPACGMG